MNQNSFLGYGLGLRHKHFNFILENRPEVDWFEALSENYLATDGRPRDVLEEISKNYSIALHGVSMNIGSTDPIDFKYLSKLRTLAEKINAIRISDHLCWTGVSGINTHDLIPLPYTEETLKHCTTRIRSIQDFLGTQILIENPSSYIGFKASTMSEASFLGRLAENSDCKLLLDINNIYVSSYNHDFKAKTYFLDLPLDRIGYIHLAGHTKKENYILDSHIGPVHPLF